MKKYISMKQRVELYCAHRQRLRYTSCAIETGLLKFAEYVDSSGYRGPLTTELAIKWAMASKKHCRSAWGRRLAYIYGFAKYYKPIDPETEIPPPNLYGSIYHRPAPYIYSEKEIYDLIKYTKKLSPITGLKPITFKYLLGLLASTGLRISEAIHLTRQNVDLISGILTVRETKCHKSRYVPLHNTTKKALINYSNIRDKKVPLTIAPEFFITDNGHALRLQQTEIDFKWLRENLGLKGHPRLYDFRHTFACQRLLQWYHKGKNVNEMMVYLATYLGHTYVTGTYWYLTAIPELMSVVSKKFEQFSISGQGENDE